MSEIHALSGAYAVDAVDPVERKLFEQHLAHCPDCRAEVASLREAASLLPHTTTVVPPPALRERLLADIAAVRPLPPASPTPETRTVTTLASRRRRAPLLAAAAAVVAMLGAGAVALEPWADDAGTQQRQPVAAEQVLDAEDAETVTHEFPGGAVATVVRSRALDRAVITTSDMPVAPTGKVYQLWFQDAEGDMVSAGVMPPRQDQTVLLEGDAAQASGAGITLEPEGGSEEPTTTPIVVFDFEQAV